MKGCRTAVTRSARVGLIVFRRMRALLPLRSLIGSGKGQNTLPGPREPLHYSARALKEREGQRKREKWGEKEGGKKNRRRRRKKELPRGKAGASEGAQCHRSSVLLTPLLLLGLERSAPPHISSPLRLFYVPPGCCCSYLRECVEGQKGGETRRGLLRLSRFPAE